ncbi:hypothetical protein SMALA_4927 [Streptomyces malaysiensis subsp. malaysiensis]|nr:hypothetical protein SMALA_4927 [Streptomyces malaysiensis]
MRRRAAARRSTRCRSTTLAFRALPIGSDLAFHALPIGHAGVPAPSGGRAGVLYAVDRTRSIGNASTGRRPPDCADRARPSPRRTATLDLVDRESPPPPRKRDRPDPIPAGGRSGRPAAPDQRRPRSADRWKSAAVRGAPNSRRPKGARGVGTTGHDGAAPRTISGSSAHFQRSAYAGRNV